MKPIKGGPGRIGFAGPLIPIPQRLWIPFPNSVSDSLRRFGMSALGPGLNAMSPSIAKLGRDISTRMHLSPNLASTGCAPKAAIPRLVSHGRAAP